MSFQVNTDPHTVDEMHSAVENVEPTAHLSDDQLELLRYGKLKAMEIVNSGKLGEAEAVTDREFVVTISGDVDEDDDDKLALTIEVTSRVSGD